ncbi:hypothetical protein [Clostridium tyrobutyricum]|uniref:hypothetical protein n=1 Tax=Clostridium tyrobutyricum TaxID=1519 RepID=UPI0011C97B8D|nr:hypothetical protein [Clostridium tyrobutyricum]
MEKQDIVNDIRKLLSKATKYEQCICNEYPHRWKTVKEEGGHKTQIFMYFNKEEIIKNSFCAGINIEVYECLKVLIGEKYVPINYYLIFEDYYILCYPNNKIATFHYEDVGQFPKKFKLIKEYKELNSDVFSDVFDLLIDRYRKLNLIK